MTENPVSLIRTINDHGGMYDAIVLWCPGCEYEGEDDHRKIGGLHMLPISGDKEKRPTWIWNGDPVQVTLTPSISTKTTRFGSKFICHSFLTQGKWQFLEDCTHSLKNQTMPMLSPPD